MMDPKNNILSGFTAKKLTAIRTSIVGMVLATDMAGHFEHVTKFKNKMNGSGLDFTDVKDRQLVLDISIKCGDVNNVAKLPELCTKWAYLIMEEFFAQAS